MQRVLFIIIAALLYSCTTTEPDEIERKMAVRLVFSKINDFYSRLDSIVITRLATWPDSTNLNNIGIDGIDIKLTTIDGNSSFNAKFKQTARGVYKLDEAGMRNIFYAKSNFQAIFTDIQNRFDESKAIYQWSQRNEFVDAQKFETGIREWSNFNNELTYLNYYRTNDYFIRFFKYQGSIDSIKIRSFENPVPQEHWLEDTTSAVWNTYHPYVVGKKIKSYYAKSARTLICKQANNQSWEECFFMYNCDFYHSGDSEIKVFFSGHSKFNIQGGYGYGKITYSSDNNFYINIYNAAQK